MAALVVLLNIQKYVIIAITAIGGANAIVLAGLLLLGGSRWRAAGRRQRHCPDLAGLVVLVGCLAGVVGLGLAVQIMLNRTYVFEREQYQQGWGN
jgi:hypothetical protein